MEHMGYNSAVTKSSNPRSTVKAKMTVSEMKASSNMLTDISIILADFPEGKRNLEANQVSILSQLSILWCVQLHEVVLHLQEVVESLAKK